MRASQLVLEVKNLPPNAGDKRDAGKEVIDKQKSNNGKSPQSRKRKILVLCCWKVTFAKNLRWIQENVYSLHYLRVTVLGTPTPVFLPGESQGRRSLVGCHLWGHTESDTAEAT